MNLSISCCITSLIIISAALLLGIVGVFYKQAACILVDSVLFQLAVFFSVFGMALHFTNRLERRPELGSPCVHQSLCPGLVYSTGWAQYLGLGGVALCTATAVSLYGLHRLVITMVNTGQPFKQLLVLYIFLFYFHFCINTKAQCTQYAISIFLVNTHPV